MRLIFEILRYLFKESLERWGMSFEVDELCEEELWELFSAPELTTFERSQVQLELLLRKEQQLRITLNRLALDGETGVKQQVFEHPLLSTNTLLWVARNDADKAVSAAARAALNR